MATHSDVARFVRSVISVICPVLLVAILFATLTVIVYSPCYYNVRSAYNLRSKYYSFTHKTRRKANITEKTTKFCRILSFLWPA